MFTHLVPTYLSKAYCVPGTVPCWEDLCLRPVWFTFWGKRCTTSKGIRKSPAVANVIGKDEAETDNGELRERAQQMLH